MYSVLRTPYPIQTVKLDTHGDPYPPYPSPSDLLDPQSGPRHSETELSLYLIQRWNLPAYPVPYAKSQALVHGLFHAIVLVCSVIRAPSAG
ncbi:unnamed protein product [Penicillium roqueforti FM164]|uniref:Uncharacterized protein n=1 Tax=Penicillium roqueforti (strain FM164) TaxID=1365484 RepID=W6QUV2_PENRF|nr:unnamed protein product [Penicillium roqueforti FM164]